MSIVAFNNNLGPVIAQSLWPKLLKTPTPTLLAQMNANLTELQENTGTTQLLVRFRNLPPAINPIAPGTAGPPPVYLQRDIISIMPQLFGAAIFIDSRTIKQDELEWSAAATERLVFSIRQGQDFNYYATLKAGAAFYACTGGVNPETPTTITSQDLSVIYAALQNNNAPFVSSVIHGTLQFNTTPLNHTYIALTSPALVTSLESIPGFNQTGSYPIQNNERAPGEFGYLTNFRFFTSSNVPLSEFASSLGNTVITTFVMGDKPYTGVSLESDAVDFLYRSPEFSNAYGLQVSFGATLYFGSGVTQDTWLINVNSSGAAPYVFGNPYV